MAELNESTVNRLIGRAPAVAAALLAIVAGCGTGTPAARDSAVAVTASQSARAAGAPVCPRTGHWSDCQVKLRLDQAGVAPRTGEAPSDLPRLGPVPTIYLLGQSPLAIYLFPDAGARERAARQLDTAKFIAPSVPLTMRGEGTAIQNDNLLALLFSRNDLQRERVSDALTAGAPQP
jgi:hypothetical protein